MTSLLFVTTYGLELDGDGISRKIFNQIKGFESNSCSVDYLCRIGDHLVLNGEPISRLSKMKRYLFFLRARTFFGRRENGYDLIYVRNPHGGLYVAFFSLFLKYFKNKGAKIILEIPHYPYEGESNSLLGRIALFIHQRLRKYFMKYVDGIAYMGPRVQEIWGAPALRIANGVGELVDIVPNPRKGREAVGPKGIVRFVGAASLAYWHGYDRLIRGVAAFNPSDTEVEFHIIGDGQPEYDRLRKLARELSVEDKVIFHGRKGKQELDEIFSDMDIGVDALGRHRSGNNYNCSIKSKEYAAKNMPFIKSHQDDSFDGVAFVYNAFPVDEPIDLDDVLRWYERLGDYGQSIREYAESNLTWKTQMASVLHFSISLPSVPVKYA